MFILLFSISPGPENCLQRQAQHHKGYERIGLKNLSLGIDSQFSINNWQLLRTLSFPLLLRLSTFSFVWNFEAARFAAVA